MNVINNGSAIYQIDPRPSVPIIEDPGWFEDDYDPWADKWDYDESYLDDLGWEIEVDQDEL